MLKISYSKFFVITFLCGWFPCFCQPDPITIQFIEAQPIWEHLVFDTNFYDVGTQQNINKYTVVHPQQIFRFNQDLVLLNYCVNYNGEIFGYILEQLDIQSGEIKWQNYSTFYNNGFQDVYKEVYLRPDGNLETVGMKRHGPYVDTLFGNWSFGNGKSNYVRKIFDYNTGELTIALIGKDSLSGIIPQDLNFFPLTIDSAYLNLQLSLKEDDNNYMMFTDFYLLDEQLNVIPPKPIGSIPYGKEALDLLSFGQPQFFKKINDSTIVGLYFQDRYKLSDAKSKLIWMDISNAHDIHINYTLETSEVIPVYKQSFAFLNFESSKQRIYITQPYKDPVSQINTSFLTVVDIDGLTMNYLSNCVDNAHYYTNLKLLYSTDSSDFFVAMPSRTNRSGLDFLKLDVSADSLEYISSLTSANFDEEFTRELAVATMYPDGIIVFGSITKKTGQVQNSAVKYYAFHASDLGIDITTGISVCNQVEQTKLYPNPTTGIIRVEFEKITSGNIILYNQLGHMVGDFNLNITGYFDLDLSSFMPGVYYARIVESETASSRIYPIFLITDK